MADQVHLLKLSAGTESVKTLTAWQTSRRAKGGDGLPRHVTRMWPKQEAALLNGGSIFWVIKGLIQCRQRILRLDEVLGADGVPRCALVFDPKLVRVSPTPKRPFQGWRYLQVGDAPADLPEGREDETPLPPKLAGALAEIGVI